MVLSMEKWGFRKVFVYNHIVDFWKCEIIGRNGKKPKNLKKFEKKLDVWFMWRYYIGVIRN